jgi:hypothetical protein
MTTGAAEADTSLNGDNTEAAELEKKAERSPVREDGKYELTESDAWEVTGYSFPRWRKWQILGVVFLIQISMNLNASMYANAVTGITKKFGVSKQAARVPQMTFLVAYGVYYHIRLHNDTNVGQLLGASCGPRA